MGLDMYAYTVDAARDRYPVDVRFCECLPATLIHRWRKHHNLHSWMCDLYDLKGGRSRFFNGDTVELTLDDLDELEETVLAGELPDVLGSGEFGVSSAEERADDLAFIAKARAAIAAGLAVYYDSWW